jgi:hypothetical protein
MRLALAEHEAQLPPYDCPECGYEIASENDECPRPHGDKIVEFADARACHEEDERDGRGTEGMRE